MNRLGWTFDTVADRYDKMRPGYPEALYRRLFDYFPLDVSCRALEVGIGSGQATLPILQTGCALTAVDPGARFCALCREKFSAYPRFSVLEGRFEEAEFPPDSLDLIYSATAFHWVPEQTGYPKALKLLRPGGAFARFANHPFPARNNPPLRAEIDALYARFYPGERKPLIPYGEEQAAACAARAAAYGFTDVRHYLFTRTRSFTPPEHPPPRAPIPTTSRCRSAPEPPSQAPSPQPSTARAAISTSKTPLTSPWPAAPARTARAPA